MRSLSAERRLCFCVRRKRDKLRKTLCRRLDAVRTATVVCKYLEARRILRRSSRRRRWYLRRLMYFLFRQFKAASRRRSAMCFAPRVARNLRISCLAIETLRAVRVRRGDFLPLNCKKSNRASCTKMEAATRRRVHCADLAYPFARSAWRARRRESLMSARCK